MAAKAMTTHIEDDHVQTAQQRVERLERELADVQAHAPRWGQTETRQQRESRERAEDLRAALADAERDHAAAVDSWRARFVAGRMAPRADLLRTMIRHAEPLLTGARARWSASIRRPRARSAWRIRRRRCA